jgi:hypothetical protein
MFQPHTQKNPQRGSFELFERARVAETLERFV